MSVSAQECKYVACIPPGVIKDDASHVEIEIDTQGYHYAEIIFFLGATDIGHATLKVQETDTTATGEADVTGLISGTSADIDGTTTVLPSATDDNQVTVFQIDLRNRKRFLSLVSTSGDGSAGAYAAAVCRLSRGDVAELTSATVADGGVMRV